MLGAANRTSTCDPVITNDVLYQLSYCGGPCGAVGETPKTPAPDIGQRPVWQEKRGQCEANTTLIDGGLPPTFGSRPIPASGAGFAAKRLRLRAPAGQESAPAAGLALCGIDGFREFVPHGLVIDAGIVRRADDGNHRRNGRGAGPGHVLALPEQRRGGEECGFGRSRPGCGGTARGRFGHRGLCR